MSDTADAINRELETLYWSTKTKSGHTVFPLRSGKNGFAPPGKMLLVREDKDQPERTVAQILSRGFRVTKEEKQHGGKVGSVVRFAREILMNYGVPR